MLEAECQVASCQILIVGTWWKLHKQLLQEDGLEDHKGLGLQPSLNIAILSLICLECFLESRRCLEQTHLSLCTKWPNPQIYMDVLQWFRLRRRHQDLASIKKTLALRLRDGPAQEGKHHRNKLLKSRGCTQWIRTVSPEQRESSCREKGQTNTSLTSVGETQLAEIF